MNDDTDDSINSNNNNDNNNINNDNNNKQASDLANKQPRPTTRDRINRVANERKGARPANQGTQALVTGE